MGTYKSSKIDGDLNVGRNASIGGDLTVSGNTLHRGDLRIEGTLECNNITGVYKGIFATAEDLSAAYPSPDDGWAAVVATGNTLPGNLYLAKNGVWTDSGKEGGQLVGDVDQYTQAVSQLAAETDSKIESAITQEEDRAERRERDIEEALNEEINRAKDAENTIAKRADGVETLVSGVVGAAAKSVKSISVGYGFPDFVTICSKRNNGDCSSVPIPAATKEYAGLMKADDKVRLEGLSQEWKEAKGYISKATNEAVSAAELANAAAEEASHQQEEVRNLVGELIATGGASNADAVTYDNDKSGLKSITVQGAVDELKQSTEDNEKAIGYGIVSIDFDQEVETEVDVLLNRANGDIDTVYFPMASHTGAGTMSAEDKRKLDELVDEWPQKIQAINAAMEQAQDAALAANEAASAAAIQQGNVNDFIAEVTISGGASHADAVAYNNKESSLESITIQGAVDELASRSLPMVVLSEYDYALLEEAGQVKTNTLYILTENEN